MQLEVCPSSQDGPRDAYEFVCQRADCNMYMPTLCKLHEPALQGSVGMLVLPYP
jgi:hypothetical protein